MDMIKDRNQTSHTYNQEVAQKIAGHIRVTFFNKFVALQTKMNAIGNEDEHQ